MKTILYLGTDPIQFESQGHRTGHLIHYPVIKIVPRTLEHPELKRAYDHLNDYTHLIFTSKNAVRVFFGHLAELKRPVGDLKAKTAIAIGEVTAAHLLIQGLQPQFIAQKETQEGIVQLLNKLNLDNAYFFMPRSSLARPILANFFKERQIRYQACDLYDTVAQILEPKPDLDQVEEIIFTSPSTVNAFLEIFGSLPRGKKLIAIGPITEQALSSCTK
jgi:uroporphyrinogen-III synthase